MAREGYELEECVETLFETMNFLQVNFQKVFETGRGLYARADVFAETLDGERHLFEVKSSTKIKKDKKHDQLKDACFQYIVAKRSGETIDRIHIIHLNGEYERESEIDFPQLFNIVDVTERVQDLEAEVSSEIDKALAFMSQDEIDHDGCSCIYKSASNHCDTFSYFNPSISAPSIYNLPRLSDNKRKELIESNSINLQGVSSEYPLSPIQSLVRLACHEGEPQINISKIRRALSKYIFPLYFFDFETYASAIPIVQGSSPHKAFPVQYSLHILEENGELSHKEYLERTPQLPRPLIQRMKEDIGENGSIVSWHASFEKSKNKDMAKWFPDEAEFIKDVNDRMVDLEDIFKSDYVDIKFNGSTSIKKVLPVLCPDLGYSGLDVQDGAAAMEAWHKMITASEVESEVIAMALLEYCRLDTYAMVEIYRFVSAL